MALENSMQTLNLPPFPNHFAVCNFVVRYAEVTSDDLICSSEFREVVIFIGAMHFIYFMAINPKWK